MGKCVSKHPSAITIASEEYLTSNNKYFIEKYSDSITIKNENTPFVSSSYINSEYNLKTASTTAAAATILPSIVNRDFNKTDKNNCNNTIVIEDYKNKKVNVKQKSPSPPQNSITKNPNNGNKKNRKKPQITKEFIVANRSIIAGHQTSQIAEHNSTANVNTATTTVNNDDFAVAERQNEYTLCDSEDIYMAQAPQIPTIVTTTTTTTTTSSIGTDAKQKKIFNNIKIRNGNPIKNGTGNHKSLDSTVDDNSHNVRSCTATKRSSKSTSSFTSAGAIKENKENQDIRNYRNENNHCTFSFNTKKISCLRKNESQDSLNTAEILKSLNTSRKNECNNLNADIINDCKIQIVDNSDSNCNEFDERDKKSEDFVQNEECYNIEDDSYQQQVQKTFDLESNNQGQTESKKKSKNIGPDTKGTAMSFGFRKKLNNTPKKQKFLKDKNTKDNGNNIGAVDFDGTIITNPVSDDFNNFHDNNGNSDITDATTISNATATQQEKINSTSKNASDTKDTTWATHRSAVSSTQNKEHFSLMGGGNGNGSGVGSGRNRFGFRSANIIRPASTGMTPSTAKELHDNNINNNNCNNNNGVTVKRRSKSASGVGSNRNNSNGNGFDTENLNLNNSGGRNVADGIGVTATPTTQTTTTKRSTLVNRNSDQQQQQKVVNEVRFADNPKINYITSVHDLDEEYNSHRPHWKHQNEMRRGPGGMTSEMLRHQFFNSGGSTTSPSAGMMNRHGNMMNNHQIITTGMHTNVILKPKPMMTATATAAACKFTLHTASLPKPQYPVPISLTTTAPTPMDTKTAKQVANNNRKGVFGPRDISTDSGLSSMDVDNSAASRSSVLRPISSANASVASLSGSESPKKLSKNRPRNLEMVISGRHKFEVRDLDALASCENVEPLSLPRLPSVFSSENQPLAPLNGLVRSNTILSRDSASTTQQSTPEDMRKTSRTNSESDSINEEKLFRDRSTTEKDTNKNSITGCNSSKNSSPASSRASWCQAGESLAIKDCSSLSISSSDDSKENRLGKTFTLQTEELSSITFDEKPSILSSLTDSSAIFPNISLSKFNALNNNDERVDDNKFDFLIEQEPYGRQQQDQQQQHQQQRQQMQTQQERPKTIAKNVGDPIKFAEMAAAVGDILLDDETSPTDSLVSSTESEEAMLRKSKKKAGEELPEKDIDEISPELDACSPPSPGTPTHASNSLSLSDIGKDFLIDDEIADQPALLFNTKKNDPHENTLHTNSITDTTPTLMESAVGNGCSQKSAKSQSKSRNLMQAAIELSLRTPISLRKTTMLSKAESWDTLSPCESISSDDLMMDFETSSMDSIDRVSQSLKNVNASALKAFDDAELLAEFESKGDEMIREWNNILRVHRTGKDSIISHLPARATRLLNRSRLQQQTQICGTTGSDSPKSNDSFNLNRKQTSSRASSAHLSNREINSSSDDLLLYDKSFRNSMIQDVLYFKKQLLRLRRILQEDEECLQRTDTLNPFEVNNGQFFASPINGGTTSISGGKQSSNENHNQHHNSPLAYGNIGDGVCISSNQNNLLEQQYFLGDGRGSSGCSDNERNFGNSLQSLTSLDDPIQELADLRRQVVYLQSQVDDRERTIRIQKNLIDKLENDNEKSRLSSSSPTSSSMLEKEVVNTATQTERVRPLSIGQEGLSRSKPEYTSYTINLPNPGSATLTTTTEIISPSVTGIDFINSNKHPASRRHTIISTTFTNLNHATRQNSTANSAHNLRRASIPWEKLVYKPVKTTLIGEPISTKQIITKANIDNSSIPTELKTNNFASSIEKNNLINNRIVQDTQTDENNTSNKINILNTNGAIKERLLHPQTSLQQSQQELKNNFFKNMLENPIKTSSDTTSCNENRSTDYSVKQNGGFTNENSFLELENSNKINGNKHYDANNNDNYLNGAEYDSKNQINQNISKLNNHKYKIQNGSNYKMNKSCFDINTIKANTNMNKLTTTNNNGSVTTIV